MEQNPRAALVPSLERATHAVALWIEASLHDAAITQAEAHVLGYLAQVGRCSINDLHHDFGHRRSTLTSILDRLETRKLVRRLPHPTSRRSVMIEPTREGRTLGKRIRTLLAELERAVLRATSPQDLETFQRMITAIEEAAHDRR